MDYLDTYWARVTKLGTTHKERELNASIADFEKYLAQHPSSETITVDGEDELASIISNKQDENKLTKKILTRLTSGVSPGTILTWKSMQWIVYFQEKNPNEAYHSNLMVQTNNTAKWINSYGVLKQSPCYIVGNMMSSVKNNFRTWMGLITPQPNQFVDFLIPFNSDIAIGVKLLIENRAWKIVEFDAISVPGIMYISCTEDKIDRMDDNMGLQIAEYDKLNSYVITALETTIEIENGATYDFYPIVKQNGVIDNSLSLAYEIVNESVADVTNISGGVRISGLLVGTTSLIITLVEEPNVTLELPISVVTTATKPVEYIISGSDIIRLGNSETYELYEVDTGDILLSIDSFSIDNTDLASGVISNGKLVITANSDGLLGNIIVTMTVSGPPSVSANKAIAIKSLW